MKPGTVLQGRYEVLGALGKGGQGTVFEATDRRLRIRVAIKHSTETQEHLRQAFVREARLLAGLRHPALPVVSDHFVQPDGQFLVLELVTGEDVSKLLRREQRRCTVDEAMSWADQLLDALEYLHAQEPPIIHRDIKPSNLRLRTDGRLMLLDFGIAKGRPFQDERGGPTPSLRGYTRHYASPEQQRGQGTDARSDLYAVGATLYALLSGYTPDDASVRAVRKDQGVDTFRPLTAHNSLVPPELARAIHRALEIDPAARFQNATEMRQAIGWQGDARGMRRRASDHPMADPPTRVYGPLPASANPSGVGPSHAGEPLAPDSEDSSLTPARGIPEFSDGPWSRRPLPPTPAQTPAQHSGQPPASPPVPPPSRIAPSGPMSAGPLSAGQPSSASGNSTARRQGEGFQLARVSGEQILDRWALAPGRPVTVGRSATNMPSPDIDLRPDRLVSRQHARIWRADHHWWISDVGSRRGTLVDGRLLTPNAPTVLRPWSTIQCGETTLFLAPPGWRRLRARGLTLDLELVGAVSSSLHHAGLPVIGRLVARNDSSETRSPSTLRLAMEPCFGSISITVPALRPGTSVQLEPPPIALRYDVLEGQIERSRRRLTVAVDGDSRLGDPVECWLLPHNEWSTLPEHQRALATFVLPNHPSVAGIAAEVTAQVDPNAPAEHLLAALFTVLAERWQLTYRLEPPHWATDSQKVRLPHAVLLDDGGRRGEGTCLDLALLAAACLENLGLQPLVAVLDLGEWWHAVVGCWDPAEPGVESVRFDTGTLLTRAIWLDPTCATRDPEIRQPFKEARAEAERLLRESPLLFALDVAAARAEGIMPLPFAGQPAWSAGVSRAIEAAHNHARAASGQLCSAALMAGLLTAGDGLTRTVVKAALGDPARAAQTIAAALPAAPPAPAVSVGYRQVLDVARSRAKSAGSPVVLETHLLGALLSMRSGSLDRVLGRLGIDQQRLARGLQDADDGSEAGGSTYYGGR